MTALTTCALTLNFFEKGSKEISIYTLAAGNQMRGELQSPKDITYYTIKLQTDQLADVYARVNLSPLKGEYVLFASRDGKLPTAESREFFSTNHQLDLPFNPQQVQQDYILGV